MSPLRVLVTGASGVLGTAVLEAFDKSDLQFETLGLSYSRTGNGLVSVDLQDTDAVDKVFTDFKPDWCIHCAAERRPDVAEKNPEGARKLNVQVPAHLAAMSKSLGFQLVYISTDYVFDGTSPPYTPASTPNPIQLYGRTKREGEEVCMSIEGAKVIILRVPILYGPAPKNSDSAVNILLDVVQDQSGKQYKMDHFATRFPTCTIDIANFLVRLTAYNKPIPLIIHYSAAEPFTKYEMCLIFAHILGVPYGHIIPDAEPPSAGVTSRPQNTQLDTTATVDLNVEGGLGLSLFQEWWTEYLKK